MILGKCPKCGQSQAFVALSWYKHKCPDPEPVKECRSCEWWRHHNGDRPDDWSLFDLGCHRRAPDHHGGFPETRPEQSCGDWEPRKKA